MTVQAPLLGKLGRFGNWLVEYLLARQFAQKYGAELQTPDWIGERLFEIAHPRITTSGRLTRFSKDGTFIMEDVVVLDMFFNLPVCMAPRQGKEEVQGTFRWRPEFSLDKIPVLDTVVHLRRGDFLNASCWPLVELDTILGEVLRLGLDPSKVRIIGENMPIEGNPYGADLSYVYDFQLMCRAQNLFVYPASSYSYMASRFNNNTVFLPSGYTGGWTSVRYLKEQPCPQP